MMEPHATTAAWNNDKLTIWTSNQMIAWAVGDLAQTLRMPKESIHVMSPFIGGGFGGKLWIRSDAVMAALGARAAGRPVKVTLMRPQVPNNTTHRRSEEHTSELQSLMRISSAVLCLHTKQKITHTNSI